MDSSTKIGYGVYTIGFFNDIGAKFLFAGRESNDHTAKAQAKVHLNFLDSLRDLFLDF